MRSLLLVVVAAGCGFSATEEPGSGGGGGNGGSEIDAARIDAAIDAPGDPMSDAAIDAPVDAPVVQPDAAIDAPPPTWTIVDTITVSCLNQTVTSTYVLLTGVTYRLRATGTCIANSSNGSQGDAEYVGFNVNNLTDVAGGVDTGIAVNDATPGPTKNPRWGAYTSTHTYEVPWVGAGATITALVHADNYSNNAGTLTLRILALQ